MPEYIERESDVIFKDSFVSSDNRKIGFTQMAYNMGYVITGNNSVTYPRAFVGSIEDFLIILALCNEESNKI